MKRLINTVQIITGAGSGLGRGAAERFASEGAKVVCADLDLVAAQTTVEKIHSAGGEASALQVDVSDWDSAQNMVETTINKYGQLDGVYANAGLHGTGSATDVEMETWDRTLAVNLTGVFYTARAALRPMLEADHGAILFTASNAALKAFPNQAAYAASKGGVVSLARQMALDFAGRGIRVNTVCPGMVLTPLVTEMYRKREEFTSAPMGTAIAAQPARYPLGRTGQPEDIAAVAAFLQSPEASWITGQSYVVDGGISI
ncbi:SDR family NAD(P)-dependent oxidoreductase [Arthrobacter sp. KNU40]|uniref:SDR family NAD(P)-dependent oxidoreductase n=1 Tax=Arthrobacter sp. KNU40 TaxID=3447965 RepID=UPI003F60CF7C